MAGKIQNRYEALARELDVSDYRPAYRMTDDVVPVIILHEHCEGSILGDSATAAGAVGPLQVAGAAFSRAGAYQVVLYWDSYKAVASQEAAYFRVQDSSTGLSLGTLWYFNFGYVSGVERGTMVIPKIHVPERSECVGYLATTLVAADQITMGFFLQPV